MALSAKDAIKKFNVELLEELPLENPIFFGMCKTADLFPLGTTASIEAKPIRAEKVAYFLEHVVEPGADNYLPKLLKVMEDSKIDNVVDLACKIQTAIDPEKASKARKHKRKKSDSSDDDEKASKAGKHKRKKSDSSDENTTKSLVISKEQFENYNDVGKAFVALQTKISILLKNVNFVEVRRACIIQVRNRAHADDRLSELIKQISKTDNFNDLFDILVNIPYWSWIDIRILEMMVTASENPQAVELLNNYKAAIFSKNLIDLLPCVPSKEIKEEYYAKVVTKVKKDPDKMTVINLLEFQKQLEVVILDIQNGICILEHLEKGCVEVHWYIPTSCVNGAYQTARVRCHQFNDLHLQYLKIGCYPVICASPVSPNRDDIPDMRDLNRHIVEQHAVQWERLGLELGLKDYHIANISKDYPNKSVTCCRVMLEQWLREIPSPTWSKLDDAIKNIKLPSAISLVSTDKGVMPSVDQLSLQDDEIDDDVDDDDKPTTSKRRRKAMPSPRAGEKRKAAPVSDSDDDDHDDDDDDQTTSNKRRKGDELVHSTTDGKKHYGFKEIEKAKNAVCILRNMGANGPKDVGTGFVGRDVENNSTVLVTCYHVIIDGIPASGKYDKADYRALNATMKEKIEENAKKFKIRIQYKHEVKDIKLEDFVISGTSKFSPNSSLDYFIMEIDEAKLRRQWEDLDPINLSNQVDVRNDNQISILHHPYHHNPELQVSFSYCRVVKSGNDVVHYVVYTAGTDEGSSGAPILKEVGQKLFCVGIHRGGDEKNWDGKDSQGYNFGSRFAEIYENEIYHRHPPGE